MIMDFSREIELVGGTVPVVTDLFSEQMAIGEVGLSQVRWNMEE